LNNRVFVNFLLFFSVILLASCSNPSVNNEKELATAQTTLESFFTLLAHGAYEQAAGLYGGDYEGLRRMNPAIPADDYASQWKNGCASNGYQCLEIKNVLKANMDDQGIFHFIVEFNLGNGNLLVVGPCCGADATQMPPLTQFEFTVRRNKGVFLVQEPPVFVP
jgi:hypothetical protein